MNTKLLLLSTFTVLYFLGAQWWYSNHIATSCCSTAEAASAAAMTSAAASLPLAFSLQQAAPQTGDDYADYLKNNILNGQTADNILQITGRFYDGETPPEGFDNMGLARAAAIRDLLKDELPAERIVISSRKMSGAPTAEGTAFDAASFNWMAAPDKAETTIVAIEDEVTIYFPFNSTVKDKNAKVDDYLKQLGERLQQTEEQISITGHTDNIGEDEANMALGQKRAESIRDLLVGYGIAANRITVDSKGERQAATSNDTDEGRHRNRRTVLRILN
ncbi:MAG: OmpA family protein [Bacteroidota bacterium]